MFRIFCVIIGYAVGCLQTAYIVGKISKIDIREHGSGNAGTTNVIRTLGLKTGLLVFFSDIFKGALGYVICSLIFGGSGNFMNGANGLLPGLYAGLGVVLGHNFPFYLGFRGGKGIASTVGVILCVDFRIAIIDYLCAIFLIGATKFISTASLCLTALFPILLYVFKYDTEAVIIGAILAIIAYIQHRENIVRLIKGKENKFTFGRK